MHFQGYIADSLRSAKGKKNDFGYYYKGSFRTEQGQIQIVLYGKSSVWLKHLAAYVHSLPKSSVRNYAFDITFSLFERKKEFRDENVQSEVPSSEKLEKWGPY